MEKWNRPKMRRVAWKTLGRQDDSTWGKMIGKGEYKVPGTRAYKYFRIRFRLHPELFHVLLQICEENKWFQQAKFDRKFSFTPM